MARPRLDTPLVRPEAAVFVWRDAFLEVLAEEPVLGDRTVTVLAALRSRCGATVAHAYDALVDECLERLASKDLSVRDASYVWSWCCEELDGGQAADPHFPDGTILAAKLRRPGSSGFVDGFRCAGDIRGAVETVRAFLASVRLAAPKGSSGPWWLLQCSLAALVPGSPADHFAWWRQDWNAAAAALEAGPLIGRIDLGDPILTHEGLAFPLGAVAPALPAGRPGEDSAAWAHRASAEVNRIAKAGEHARKRAGIVKDPRVGLDTRPLRWALLSRCGGASTEAIAKAAGCTPQAVLRAVAQVEKRVGLVL
jgi:hypothetical protein